MISSETTQIRNMLQFTYSSELNFITQTFCNSGSGSIVIIGSGGDLEDAFDLFLFPLFFPLALSWSIKPYFIKASTWTRIPHLFLSSRT